MQNVLVDDRRIWVDLYVPSLDSEYRDTDNPFNRTAHNLSPASILPGRTILPWDNVADVEEEDVAMGSAVDSAAEKISRPHDDTEMAVTTAAVNTGWCLMSRVIEDIASATGTATAESARAHGLHTRDPTIETHGSAVGATAETEIERHGGVQTAESALIWTGTGAANRRGQGRDE